ncbi:MAG: hypothetical protein ACYC9L_03060 [Sulfuricaulis sp.]
MNRRRNPSPDVQAHMLWLAVEPTPEIFQNRLVAAGFSPDEIREIFLHCDAIKRDLLARLSRLSSRAENKG